MGISNPNAVTAVKRLLEVVAAGAMMCHQDLKALYAALGLGRGFLGWRKMPQDTEAATVIEVWAYLSALMVSMVERHHGASEARTPYPLVQMLEGALLDAKRINYRPEYEEYRLRLREGRSSLGVPDSKLLGAMYGLHAEFVVRVANAWAVTETARHVRDRFMTRLDELTKQAERGYQKILDEVWSRRAGG